MNFKTGYTPWNKGMKGVYSLPNQYMKNYKPGMKHPRHKPIGSEHQKKGYIRVKIAENTWKYKHVHIWEQIYGELPKGYIVLFADKNNRNFDHNNLIAVSRKELAVMNRQGLIYNNSDATKAGKVIAQIKIKIRERLNA